MPSDHSGCGVNSPTHRYHCDPGAFTQTPFCAKQPECGLLFSLPGLSDDVNPKPAHAFWSQTFCPWREPEATVDWLWNVEASALQGAGPSTQKPGEGGPLEIGC